MALRRRRGGASIPCPRCGSPSRVVETRRAEEWVKFHPTDGEAAGLVGVIRSRVCRRSRTHRFRTREVSLD